MKARRQDVHEEATDEFQRVQRHGLRRLGARDAVVLVAKRDALAVDVEQSLIRDRDAMGVAADVVEHLRGPANGRLAYTTHSVCRAGARCDAKARASARGASEPANRSCPAL